LVNLHDAGIFDPEEPPRFVLGPDPELAGIEKISSE
jgi:hypothetical protein